MRIKPIFLSFLVLFLFNGCANQGKQVKEGELVTKSNLPIPLYGKVKSAISPRLLESPPVKVAILPAIPSKEVLDNVASWKDVNPIQLFRTVVFGRFSVLPFKDVHIKKVDRILEENNLNDPELIKKKSPAELGALLNVDALIYLELNEVENVTGGVHSRTEYAAILKMIDTQTEEELWRAELKENSFGGVFSGKASQLADLVAFEKANKDRPLAFRKIAEKWSHKVIEDFKEKWTQDE